MSARFSRWWSFVRLLWHFVGSPVCQADGMRGRGQGRLDGGMVVIERWFCATCGYGRKVDDEGRIQRT